MKVWQVVLLGAVLLLVGCGGGSERRTVVVHLRWSAGTPVEQAQIGTRSDTHGGQDFTIERPASGETEITLTATTDSTIQVLGVGSDPLAWNQTGVCVELPLQECTIQFGGAAAELHAAGDYFQPGAPLPQSLTSGLPVEWLESFRAYGIGAAGEIVLFTKNDLTYSSSDEGVAEFVSPGVLQTHAAGSATLTLQAGAGGPSDSFVVTVQ